MNMGIVMQAGGLFTDPRWIDGNWDIAQFKDAKGETDWDAVIDAESTRRRYLEAFPEVSTLEDEVKFDTNMVPWWVWVRRFHLPEAEKINGVSLPLFICLRVSNYAASLLPLLSHLSFSSEYYALRPQQPLYSQEI